VFAASVSGHTSTEMGRHNWHIYMQSVSTSPPEHVCHASVQQCNGNWTRKVLPSPFLLFTADTAAHLNTCAWPCLSVSPTRAPRLAASVYGVRLPCASEMNKSCLKHCKH
jgi:hypothetical protein